jgi:hypothetical protein
MHDKILKYSAGVDMSGDDFKVCFSQIDFEQRVKVKGSRKFTNTLNGFQLFSSAAQLTSYCGYDVVENQSGKRKGKTRISKKGNAHIRKALHFPALNVVRFKTGTFPDLFERILDRTRIPMKGYVAVQRKLLCLIFTLWKKEQAFDPQFHLVKSLAQ